MAKYWGFNSHIISVGPRRVNSVPPPKAAPHFLRCQFLNELMQGETFFRLSEDGKFYEQCKPVEIDSNDRRPLVDREKNEYFADVVSRWTVQVLHQIPVLPEEEVIRKNVERLQEKPGLVNRFNLMPRERAALKAGTPFEITDNLGTFHVPAVEKKVRRKKTDETES